MRIRRLKNYRKHVSYYKTAFGFHEPFQILVDLTFCQLALHHRINIKEQLSKYLGGNSIELFTTKCILHEGETLGSELKGAVMISKGFQVRRCHHKKKVAAGDCILSFFGEEENTQRLFVASQDRELRSHLQRIPGTPLIFINHNAVVLEPPSKSSQAFTSQVEANKLLPSEHEKKALGGLKVSDDKMKPRRKRKGPSGPNPLSVKKRAKITTSNTPKETQQKEKRKRKPKNIPVHVVTELLQTS